MADQIEKKVVLDITAPGAAATVADLKNNISLLKEQVAKAKIGTEEYQNALNELKLNQNALKDANYATGSSFETVAQGAAGAGESYNALVHRLAALKEQYRTIDPTIEGNGKKMADLAVQINDVNGKLKAYDANIGNYQRNVGNYAGSIMAAMGKMQQGFTATAGSAKGVIAPIMGITTGLKALSATPAIAILGLLANLLTKLGQGFSSSEENMNSLSRAFAAFKPIADSVTRTLQSVAGFVGALANKIVDFLDKVGLLSDASKQRIAMEEDAQKLRKMEREMLVENARLEEQATELRAKAAEKDKYTARQREKMLEEASEKMLKIEENHTKLAEERLRIAQLEASLSRNDAATNDNLARIEAEAIEARVKYNTTQRRLNRELSATRQEISRDTAKAMQDTGAELKELDDLIKSVIDSADSAIEKEFSAWEKATDEALKAQAALEARRLSDIEKGTARRQQAAEMEIQDARALEDRKAEIQAQGLEKRAEMLRAFTADAYERGDYQTALKYEEQLADAEFQIEYEGYKRRAALREREVSDRKALLQGMVSTTVSILGSIADAFEAAGDMSEAEAKRMKGLRIAGAIIETLAGAVSAYMGTLKSLAGSPFAIPVAAANAAAVLATGYAQVAKIQNTSATKGNASSPAGGGMQSAAVNAPAPVQMVPVTRSLTSASEEDRLNRMADKQRVVLVYSDVQAAGQRTEVVDSETDL